MADDAAPAAPAAPAPADATATPAAPAATPADATAAPAATPLKDLVDTFWHYGKIARYDLAADAGEQILSASSDSAATLEAFETVAGRKGDNIDYWMLRWETLPVATEANVVNNGFAKANRESIMHMRDVTRKLIDRLNEGYSTRRSDPQFIENTIVEMSKSARAYDNNLPRLAKSGELAVKVLVDYLRDPNKRQYNITVRRALRDLGRTALSPLLAATEMKDYDTLVDVVAALGDIGYDAAVPYLAHLATDKDFPSTVHAAARTALTHMGAPDPKTMNVANEFYNLAEKIYYKQASISPSGDKTAYVWFWREDRGLTKRDVPVSIFPDVMAMRAAEYALKLDPSNAEAVSLWIAADTRREVDLPPGAADPTHRDDPEAHYYSVSAGVQYLNQALSRSMKDRDAALTLKLTQSLRDIIGQSSMSGGGGQPLMQALFFPNRQVRYEAALGLADSYPSQPFNGSDRVVPLLVEAMRQVGKPNILIVAPTDSDQLNIIRGAVQSLGLPMAAASDPAQAITAAVALPAVDVIIISEDSDVRRMIGLEQNVARLQGASMLVLTHRSESPYAVRAATDSLMNAAVMPDKADMATTLKDEIERARQHAGASLLTEEQATAYALRAADVLTRLATRRDTVFNLPASETGVLGALSDSRPEIVKAAGKILAMLDSSTAQNGLASKALDESAAPDVRISLFKNLVANAKLYGNRLDGDRVSALEKVVASASDPGLRDAAAQARGALNLPADQARTLILGQSRT